MTTIFTYPIKDAWVLVSDKLETNQTESERINNGYETYPYDVNTKVKIFKQYIFGLAGYTEDIGKISNLLESCINENFEFKKFEKGLQTLYGTNLSKLDVELIIVDSNLTKAYKIIIKDLPDNLSSSEISSIENGYIGSGATKGRAKFQTTPIFNSMSNLNTKNNENLILIKSIMGLEILARSDPQFTGHPSIFGANILIASKLRIFDYKIQTNGYRFKESQQPDWVGLES